MRSIHPKYATAGLATVLALIGSCTSPPRRDPGTGPEHDLVGKFVWVMPPEIHEEFDLLPDGTLRWLRWNTHRAGPGKESGIEARGTGRWEVTSWTGRETGLTVELDAARFDRRPLAFNCNPIRLTVRLHEGQRYLLRPNDLSWFERHGPMVEFCLHRRGAPLKIYQPFFHPAPRSTDPSGPDRSVIRSTERQSGHRNS
ncbi:MAG: hypothetical protein NXI31_21515 [bacterium]|nr:hypothetical protein [bacterium]